MKRILAYLLAGCMVVSIMSGCGSKEETAVTQTTTAGQSAAAGEAKGKFPKDNINVLVPFGAGGGTDNVARPIASLVEKDLGVSLIVNNVTGASGATGAQQIVETAPDGYNLLFSAENVCIYDAM